MAVGLDPSDLATDGSLALAQNFPECQGVVRGRLGRWADPGLVKYKSHYRPRAETVLWERDHQDWMESTSRIRRKP